MTIHADIVVQQPGDAVLLHACHLHHVIQHVHSSQHMLCKITAMRIAQIAKHHNIGSEQGIHGM